MTTSFEDIKDTLDLMDAWAARYTYIIELGREVPDYVDVTKVPRAKMSGWFSRA